MLQYIYIWRHAIRLLNYVLACENIMTSSVLPNNLPMYVTSYSKCRNMKDAIDQNSSACYLLKDYKRCRLYHRHNSICRTKLTKNDIAVSY